MKILIVDDSPMLRNMLTTALTEGGYNDIHSAIDGENGLEKAESIQYDFIITDINMPKMDGIEMVTKLRKMQNYLKTPILVLTTERTDEMKRKGKKAGATAWIVKPFVQSKLLEAIKIINNKNK